MVHFSINYTLAKKNGRAGAPRLAPYADILDRYLVTIADSSFYPARQQGARQTCGSFLNKLYSRQKNGRARAPRLAPYADILDRYLVTIADSSFYPARQQGARQTCGSFLNKLYSRQKNGRARAPRLAPYADILDRYLVTIADSSFYPARQQGARQTCGSFLNKLYSRQKNGRARAPRLAPYADILDRYLVTIGHSSLRFIRLANRAVRWLRLSRGATGKEWTTGKREDHQPRDAATVAQRDALRAPLGSGERRRMQAYRPRPRLVPGTLCLYDVQGAREPKANAADGGDMCDLGRVGHRRPI